MIIVPADPVGTERLQVSRRNAFAPDTRAGLEHRLVRIPGQLGRIEATER